MSSSTMQGLLTAQSDIQRAREKFFSSAAVLEQEVERSMDWRTWVRRKPAFSLSLAFGIGFFLGSRRG